MTIYEEADQLLYEYGLLDILKKYGRVFVVGSYQMGIMTWNDLDFYMDRDDLHEKNYYDLAADILRKMTPMHFDGHLDLEKNSAFLGAETGISGKRWNLDIWWKEKAEIEAAIAHAQNMTASMKERPELKNAVMEIKQGLIARKLYGFDKGKRHYHSQEIYEAVFDEGIFTTEQFLLRHPK